MIGLKRIPAKVLPMLGLLLLGLILSTLATAQGETSVAQISASLRDKDFAVALQQTNAALATDSRDPKLWVLQGIAYRGLQQPKRALASFRQALKLSPDYLPALEGAAKIEYDEDEADAPAILKRLLAVQPANDTAHAMMAVVLYRRHHCADAVSDFKAALPVISGQPDALTEYGICLAHLEQYQLAASIFAEALQAQPQNVQYRYNLASTQWKSGDAESALRTLQPALDAGQGDPSILMLAADIFESQNDTPRAVELLRSAILANPEEVEPYLQFASLSYNHNSYQPGISILSTGLTRLPNSDRLHTARGVLYVQVADYARAFADFEEADRLNPEQSSAGAAQGLAQMQEHNESGAIDRFRLQVKKQPRQALGYLFLAQALAQQGKPAGSPEYKEEVQAALRAAELDSQMAAAHDLLATIYLQSGQPDLAIQHCKLALAIDPSDQEALYHMVVAMRKMRRNDEAGELLKRLATLKRQAQDEAAKKINYRLLEPSPQPAPSSE